MLIIDPSFQMWITFALIGVAIISYALERIPLELTSIGIVTALLLLFFAFPVRDADGSALLGSRQLLAGFADPALFTILALLVIGQALIRTGALDEIARIMIARGGRRPRLLLTVALAVALLVSAILNNTPVVVMFIPVLTALSVKLHQTVSKVMIPLSFAAILGGNLTLIGSSTNLLVAGALEGETGITLDFFAFTIPGAVLAAVGFLYVIFVAPRLLKDRAGLTSQVVGSGGRQFIVQLEVAKDGPLVGEQARAGLFPALKDLTVRMVLRGDETFLPPFEDVTLEDRDLVVLAATRSALTDLISRSPEMLQGAAAGSSGEATPDGLPEGLPKGDLVLVEAMIAPASRMDGQQLSQSLLRNQTNCLILGVQRRSRMIRGAMSSIRLEAGDVLLVLGHNADVLGLHAAPDIILLERTATDLPLSSHSRRALGVFALVVGLAATGLVEIPVAAISGATMMIAGRCLNVRQAARAIDRRIILIIGAALAMGAALTATGGAAYLAERILTGLDGAPPAVILSVFFLLVAVMTNILSNNATAVLFTPIAVSVAGSLAVDPMVFVIAVIFAANCSFATPMGYQTNLLVMGPGHYRFADYLRVGIPLTLIIWATFSVFAPWYFGLI